MRVLVCGGRNYRDHARVNAVLEEGKPDLVIAFPGGRGTADMVRKARRAGVEVVEISHGPA